MTRIGRTEFERMLDGSKNVVELLRYPDTGRALPDFLSSLRRFEDPSSVGEQSGNQTLLQNSAGTSAEITTSKFSSEYLERRFESGREQGIHEGRELERQSQSARLDQVEQSRMAQTAEMINQFARERDRFFASIERDVVALTLSIAERVLRREAQMDPLFLLGAVRVALGQLAGNIHVRVRVPSSESELWAETLAHLPNLKTAPEIVPDANMQLGDCQMESEMGSVDLGLDTQLHSIRRALFDEEAAPTLQPRPKLNEEGAE
jgi:flagellar assembly protein FliH